MAPAADGDALQCAECGHRYPIIGGIPRFVPADNYAVSFGEQWKRHARTQLDSHSKRPISRERVLEASGWPESIAGERVLEAGSGAGRFTEVLLAMGADVCSFDYSAAVEANFANNGASERLRLFQGNIFDIPLAEQSFDKVLCLGVLQHTPDPAKAFASLTRYVRPGGQLVVDIYPKRLSAVVSWKYVLRPITKRMNRQTLLTLVERSVDALLPLGPPLRAIGGSAAVRLLPISEYSHLGLAPDLAREWAVLDTFDSLAPAHDHPQTEATLRRWYEDAGFDRIHVAPGPNGIIGRGSRP